MIFLLCKIFKNLDGCNNITHVNPAGDYFASKSKTKSVLEFAVFFFKTHPTLSMVTAVQIHVNCLVDMLFRNFVNCTPESFKHRIYFFGERILRYTVPLQIRFVHLFNFHCNSSSVVFMYFGTLPCCMILLYWCLRRYVK